MKFLCERTMDFKTSCIIEKDVENNIVQEDITR